MLDQYLNKIICTDAFDLMDDLEEESLDAIITDPPYGMGLDEWDKKIDIERFLASSYRLLKKPGFLAFTMTMPYLEDWIIARRASYFEHKEQVIWAKRQSGAYASGLARSFENLMIWQKGSAKFFEKKGYYADVKVPGILFDLIEIGSIQRYINALWQRINGKEIKPHSGLAQHASHKHKYSKPREMFQQETNFTTVWSFLPENMLKKDNISAINHASVKPVLLFERALRLLVPEGGIALDPFSGSGTLALAAKRCNRQFICGDVSQEYVDLSYQRLNNPEPLISEQDHDPDDFSDLPLWKLQQ